MLLRFLIASSSLTLLLLAQLPVSSSFAVTPRHHAFAAVTELYSSPSDDNNIEPLCDLQTFLKLTQLVETGGSAKTAIQAGHCLLNGAVETRRAKKLYPGDVVRLGPKTLDVSENVAERGYVYKKKVKKVKPLAKVIAADGTLEFGGRFRNEEWRKERKQKKADRKRDNAKDDEEEDRISYM